MSKPVIINEISASPVVNHRRDIYLHCDDGKKRRLRLFISTFTADDIKFLKELYSKLHRVIKTQTPVFLACARNSSDSVWWCDVAVVGEETEVDYSDYELLPFGYPY